MFVGRHGDTHIAAALPPAAPPGAGTAASDAGDLQEGASKFVVAVILISLLDDVGGLLVRLCHYNP